jgi:CTP-dependent riboflavin kinase
VCKKDIKLYYKEILNELYKSQRGLQPYTLYSRLSIEAEVILRFIKKYRQLGYIDVNDDGSKIELTEVGRDQCGNEIQKLSQDAKYKDDNYLSAILVSPINVYTPYVPLSLYTYKRKQDIIPF